MHHSIKQIIKNQSLYKQQIFQYLLDEFKTAKSELNTIESSDEFILKEKKKLVSKFKKLNVRKYIEKLFFLHSKRNEKHYVWWDDNKQEAQILSYDDQDE